MSAPETLSEELVYRIAPNGKAAQAGLDLAERGAFSHARISPDRTWLGASCQGSEPQPYTVQVDLRNPARVAASCTCPSYQHPCKHALGLLLLAVRFPAQFETAEPSAAPKDVEGGRPATAEVEPRPTAEPVADAATLEEAFLQAIFAEPAEDTHRLAYADWLEERGGPAAQARAEFIRVQIELARRPADDARAPELRQREKKLWEANRSAWLETVPRSLRRPDLCFHRGFLEEMRLPPAGLLRHGEALFRRHPIQRVHLEGRLTPQEASELAVRPFLARLSALGIGGGVTTTNPFTGLPHLLLSSDPEALRVLLGTPYLSGLTELYLGRSGLGRRGAAVLAACPWLPHLTALDLSYCFIGDRGVEALVTAPDLSRLRSLRLDGNQIGNPGLAALLASPRLSNLKELSLADNRFGPRAAQALAASPPLANLTSLEVQGNKLGKRAAEALRQRFGERVRLE
jgi:uncharacterized protein (TIGR02996 family)